MTYFTNIIFLVAVKSIRFQCGEKYSVGQCHSNYPAINLCIYSILSSMEDCKMQKLGAYRVQMWYIFPHTYLKLYDMSGVDDGI